MMVLCAATNYHVFLCFDAMSLRGTLSPGSDDKDRLFLLSFSQRMKQEGFATTCSTRSAEMLCVLCSSAIFISIPGFAEYD